MNEKRVYIFCEFVFGKSQVVIEVIVENCGAFIERGSRDGNAFTDVFLSLENILTELIDLVKKLNN